MPSTYTPIATYTVPSTVASYTFTSIPSTYTDLVLVTSGTISATSDMYMQFNSDTSAFYSKQLFYGTGSAAGGATYTSVAQIGWGYQGTTQATIIANIMNYANTTKHKTVLSKSGSGNDGVQFNCGSWNKTAAINSIKIYPAAANLNTGFTLTLYGITAA